MSKPTLKELKEKFKGVGDVESETVLVDSNMERKDGYVSIWSNKTDIPKIISRCERDIINYEIVGDGIQFTIDRKAFRGMQYAFRDTSKGGRKLSEDQLKERSERMKKYWADRKKES